MNAYEAALVHWINIKDKILAGEDIRMGENTPLFLAKGLEAIEKQIPKKPFIPWDSMSKDHICPECKFGVMATQKYCDKCGQALDWGDYE